MGYVRAHLKTGNYSNQKAKTYMDISLFTSNQKVGSDATNLFNYLSGHIEKPEFHCLSLAPFMLRADIVEWIDAEIRFQKT